MTGESDTDAFRAFRDPRSGIWFILEISNGREVRRFGTKQTDMEAARAEAFEMNKMARAILR